MNKLQTATEVDDPHPRTTPLISDLEAKHCSWCKSLCVIKVSLLQMNKAQGDGARNGCKGGRNPAPVRMQENRHGLETHFSNPPGAPKVELVGECLQTDWCCREVHHPGYGNPARLDDQSRNCPQVWIPCLLVSNCLQRMYEGSGPSCSVSPKR